MRDGDGGDVRGIKALKFAGVLLLLAFAGSAVVWYVTVTSERERYLTSRNFRLLSTIATQLDSSIGGQLKTFGTLLSAADGKTENGIPTWFARARDFVPSLEALDTERLQTTFDSAGLKATRAGRLSQAVLDDRGAWLQLSIKTKKQKQSGASAKPSTGTVYLGLSRLLAPVFAPKLRDGAFDALVLASTDGRVLHAEGSQSAVLKSARLDQLEPANRPFVMFGNPETQPAPPGYASIARTSGVVDVRISGTAYKLFTQPCCLATRIPADGAIPEAGLVIVGLVDAAAFGSKTRQITPTVVIVCVAAVLLAVASWPFLKLKLIGERQRVKRLDVVEIIAGGMFGIALLTVVCLDLYGYGQFNQTRDDQLENLAGTLSGNVLEELNDAFDQLATLTSVILPCPSKAATRDGKIETAIFANPMLLQCDGKPIPQSYPQFKTMALIGPNGMQDVKWTSRVWQPEPIAVGSRAYFVDAKAGRFWKLPQPKPHASVPDPNQPTRDYLLESIWSWTTTEPEAVLSMATGHKALPVAAVTIPMMSLVSPVIAGGFEFAVIEDDGDVVFHSDPQRNTHENLFEETDQNRRLRAAVAAHIDEHLDLLYAGRSYRAYVRRLGAGTPWSVITLSAKEAGWALHTEWLVVALAALLAHMLVLAVLFGLCFFARNADWLWADARQASRYRMLSLLVVAFLVLGGLALSLGDNTLVLLASSVLPLLAWAISYVVVRRPPREGKPPREVYADYATLTVLLFLLTAAIPAAGFFSVAHRMQLRSEVKYTQLQLARDIPRRADRLRTLYAERPGVTSPVANDPTIPVYDLNYAFGNSTTLRLVTKPESEPPASSGDPDGLLHVLEEYLPYYSERSVQMRELLLHERANDQAWWWHDGDQPSLVLKGAGAEPSLFVSSTVPSLARAGLSTMSMAPGIWSVLAAMVLAAFTWVIVRFIETHICLVGVDQPLWSKARLAGSSGDNLYVVCDHSDRKALADGTFELRLEPMSGSSTPDQDLMHALRDLDRKDPGRPVLLADFDEHLDDPKLTRRKLDWIERLAADQTRSLILLSSASPSLLDHAFRVESRGAEDPQLLERWRKVLASFVVINWRAGHPRVGPPATVKAWWRELWERLHPSPGTWRAPTQLGEALQARRDGSAREALRTEAEADAFVRAVCASIEGRLAAHAAVATVAGTAMRLSPDQVLDEVAERTDAWYKRIWKTCSPDEQLVLAEIASEGFVNYKSRRTVRRLLARGLIAKDPSFRLMNTTFRRFVLSAGCQQDVHALEGTSDPSTWDRVRAPFFAALVGISLFFLVTQREMFTATVATLSTVVAAVPILFRVVALVTGKRAADLEIPKM